MTEHEYQLIQEGLRKKLHKHAQLSNREEGYNNGILLPDELSGMHTGS